MATFEYIAKSATGEEVRGRMQADNESAVLRTLDENSLFPVRVEEARGQVRVASGKVRSRDLSLIYAQLADLLNAGVPLLRALGTIIHAAPNPAVQGVMTRVRDDVAEGKALAEALSAQGTAFPSLHAAMIRAAERGGFLEDTLANLGEYLERIDDLRSRVRGALIYPAVLVTLGLGAILFVLLWLVPQFRTMFENVPLPVPTRILFATSDVLVWHWPLVLAGAVATGAAVVSVLRSGTGRRWWERAQLRVPLVGSLISAVAITRFCRILGTLMKNGVPILQALSISRDAAGSTVLAGVIDTAAESVRAGESLAGPLSESGLFPPEVVEMIAVAEESNQLEKVLLQIADTVERRANRKLEVVVRLMEPLILVVIAGVIAFVALGLFFPIFSMSRTLR